MSGSTSKTVILPGSTIGILGGGQLGRMTAMAARSLGYRVQVLDPDPSCPARFVVDSCFAAPLDDAEAAADLARGCDVVTIEIEKVGLAAMRAAAEHAPVRPDARVLEIIQHRARQKEWLAKQGFPIGPYRVVNTAAELERAAAEIAQGGDCFLKAAEGGYDGRGQAVLHSPTDAHKAWLYLGAEVCVVEKAVEIAQEISVLAARNPNGEISVYSPALNHHEKRILDWSVIPAPIPRALAEQATTIARQIAEALNIVGLVTVEMFVQKNGELFINELAPRPHNSYHSSERACATSQFEQAVRAVCNLPLGSVEILKPAAIINLLGDVWLKHQHPKFDAALSVPGVRLHLYEKQIPKPGRKMGHLSAVADTPEEAVARVQHAKSLLDS
ncbi:MAG: purK [Acidobacteriaceae bacterium]|nr:purK [Acidobacteriaceae bacterium]